MKQQALARFLAAPCALPAVLLWLCAALAPEEVRAQSAASISGFVTDSTSGEPVQLVNIVLRRDTLAAAGAATNRDGVFFLTGLAPGAYLLTASFVGYETYRQTLVLAPDERRAINIKLKPGQTGLNEVVVESESAGGAARITAGQQTIRPADIQLVPTLDVSSDLASYLTTIPGIVSSGDRGGQLFVRGGEPSQNLVQIDGITLYQPFHLLGFYSSVPTEVLSRADVYAGGFGSRFGERTSSVIDIWTRNGNNQRFAADFTASPFVSSTTLEGPILKGRASFLASARQSLIRGGIEQIVGRDLPFTFGDFLLKSNVRTSESGRLSLTGLYSYDKGILAEETYSRPAEELRFSNTAVGARYVFIPRALNTAAEAHLSYSRLDTDQGDPADPSRRSEIESLKFALEATVYGDRTDVDAGMVIQFMRLESLLSGWYQNLDASRAGLNSFALYADPRIHTGWGLMIRPSVRMQFYNISINPSIEPRIRLVFEHGRHEMSAAVGLYKQELVGLTDRRDAASVFTAWANVPGRYDKLRDLPRDNEITNEVLRNHIQQARHALAGYRFSPRPWMDVAVEGYYKQLKNLFISEWTAFPRFTTRLQKADGQSYGAEARLEMRGERLYGLATYGFSSTRYEARQQSLLLWYGADRLRFRPPHDRRHQVNLLGNLDLGGFDLSARWELGSGLPFTRPIGFDGFILMDDVLDPDALKSSRRVLYEAPYRGVLPAYHRLDFSLARSFRLQNADVTVQGSVINAYNRANIFYIDAFTYERVDQLPLIPSLALKVAL